MPSPLSSLTNRIFLAGAVLVFVATGVTAAFVSSRVTAQAESELQQELAESGAVVGRQGEAMAEIFSVFARLIADLPKLKAAVATGDPPTVQPLAVEYQRLLSRSSVVVVTDATGRVLALAGPRAGDGQAASALPSVEAAVGGSSSQLRQHVGRRIQSFHVEPDRSQRQHGIAVAAPEFQGRLSPDTDERCVDPWVGHRSSEGAVHVDDDARVEVGRGTVVHRHSLAGAGSRC